MKGSILHYFMKTYGIGYASALKMCYLLDIGPSKPAEEVSIQRRGQALAYITQQKKVGFSLQAAELSNLLHQDQIGSWRGLRLKAFLPVNGQRTKTNGITARKRAQVLRNQLANASRHK